MIEVLQAFEEKKQIQKEYIIGEWGDVFNPTFNFDKYKFRVKPQPQYQPFTYEDYMAFMDSKVRLDDCIGEVTLCNGYGVMVGGIMFSYESAFNDIVFIDGSKFGKEI